nr:MAG TPA: hypothetical protein [Caudoviricetes sp.]
MAASTAAARIRISFGSKLSACNSSFCPADSQSISFRKFCMGSSAPNRTTSGRASVMA